MEFSADVVVGFESTEVDGVAIVVVGFVADASAYWQQTKFAFGLDSFDTPLQ